MTDHLQTNMDQSMVLLTHTCSDMSAAVWCGALEIKHMCRRVQEQTAACSHSWNYSPKYFLSNWALGWKHMHKESERSVRMHYWPEWLSSVYQAVRAVITSVFEPHIWAVRPSADWCITWNLYDEKRVVGWVLQSWRKIKSTHEQLNIRLSGSVH